MPSFTPCCAHDHDCADEDCGAAYSLYKHIDMPRVRRGALLLTWAALPLNRSRAANGTAARLQQASRCVPPLKATNMST